MAVEVHGPDGKTYQFPDGTTKDAAVGYFKKKGIGVKVPDAPQSFNPAEGAADRRSSMAGDPVKSLLANTPGALPFIGAGVGAALGGIPGAALGGAAGKAGEQIADRAMGKETPKTSGAAAKDIGVEGLEQGALEYFGGKLAPKILERIGKMAGPRAAKAMNALLELQKKHMGWSKRNDAEAIEAVGRTVNEHVGLVKSEEELASKISQAKQIHNAKIDTIVQAPGSRISALHPVIDNIALQASHEAELQGNQALAKQILATADELRSTYPANATPEELLKFKRAITNEGEWKSRGLSGTRQFRMKLYHEANDSIARALPQSKSQEFKAANRTVSRLISAEEALKDKAATQALGKKRLSNSEALKTAGRYALGSSIGASAGFSHEHSASGAITGALAGAALTKAAESTATRSIGIQARKAIAKAAPKLARAAKASPQAARALESIKAIQAQPSR